MSMEEWLENVYKNWKKYTKKFFVGIIVFMLVVHILFKAKLGICWLEAEWSAGDILSFAGTLLSFGGTVILGCITAKLSVDNNNINSRLVEIERKREVLDRDRRLGYIIAERIDINYSESEEAKTTDCSKRYNTIETERCTYNTDRIFFSLKMKITGESIINKLTCTSVKICEIGFDDDFQTRTSRACWIPFYWRKEEFARGINLIDNSFEEIVILSKADREPEAVKELKKLMIKGVQYMICLEYQYVDTLQETRKQTLQITCREDRIIKNEITYVE